MFDSAKNIEYVYEYGNYKVFPSEVKVGNSIYNAFSIVSKNNLECPFTFPTLEYAKKVCKELTETGHSKLTTRK